MAFSNLSALAAEIRPTLGAQRRSSPQGPSGPSPEEGRRLGALKGVRAGAPESGWKGRRSEAAGRKPSYPGRSTGGRGTRGAGPGGWGLSRSRLGNPGAPGKAGRLGSAPRPPRPQPTLQARALTPAPAPHPRLPRGPRTRRPEETAAALPTQALRPEPREGRATWTHPGSVGRRTAAGGRFFSRGRKGLGGSRLKRSARTRADSPASDQSRAHPLRGECALVVPPGSAPPVPPRGTLWSPPPAVGSVEQRGSREEGRDPAPHSAPPTRLHPHRSPSLGSQASAGDGGGAGEPRGAPILRGECPRAQAVGAHTRCVCSEEVERVPSEAGRVSGPGDPPPNGRSAGIREGRGRCPGGQDGTQRPQGSHTRIGRVRPRPRKRGERNRSAHEAEGPKRPHTLNPQHGASAPEPGATTQGLPSPAGQWLSEPRSGAGTLGAKIPPLTAQNENGSRKDTARADAGSLHRAGRLACIHSILTLAAGVKRESRC